MQHVYLASRSPRRLQLLEQLGIQCHVVPADVDETPLVDESPANYVQRLAVKKARSASAEVEHKNWPIIAADTAVTCDKKILGKPANQKEAFATWSLLSNRSHEVYTGVAVALGGQVNQALCQTTVHFRELSEQDMKSYWDSDEPHDKAGGYGIQGKGALFVKRIEGSYSNVVGLPLFETGQLLADIGAQVI